MIHPHQRQADTTPEDEAFLAGARRLGSVFDHPFAIGFLAIAGAALLFRLGISIGASVQSAFEGEGAMAAAFGGTFVTILVAIIALGALLDRRQRTRDAQAGPLSDEQRDRLRALVEPTSPLVRWYRPLAIVLFVVLAVPGAWLLDAPWDGLWVVVVLAANPFGRWLRADGHVLTTRDLGFTIPGLSPWPSIATAALAATTGMAVAVSLWAEALDSTLATTLTGIAVGAVIIGCGFVTSRHERRHIATLLHDQLA